MPTLPLTSWNLRKALESHAPGFKLSRIPIPEMNLQVECSITPEAYTLVSKPDGGDRLRQTLHDICQEAYTKRLSTIAWQLNTCDAQCANASDVEYSLKLQRQVQEQISGELEKARQEALTRVTERFRECGQRSQVATRYVLGLGAKAVGALVGGVTSAFGLAAGPLGLLAIIGMYRSFVEGGELIATCMKEASVVQVEVEEELKALDESYKKATRGGVGRELLASAFNALLSPPPGFTRLNVGTLEEKVGTWGGKLARLDATADYLNGKLEGLLNACNKLKEQLVNDPDSGKKKAALAAMEKNVGLLLDKGYWIPSMMRMVTIEDAHRAAEDGFAAQKQAKKGIEELKAQRSIAVDAFDKIIKVVTSAALMIASPPKLDGKLAEKAMESAGFVNDSTKLFVDSFGIGYDLPADLYDRKMKEIEGNEKKESEQAMYSRPRLNAAVWQRPSRKG